MGDTLKAHEEQTMDKDIPQKLERVIEPVINSQQLSNEQKVEQVGNLVAGMIAVSQESFSGPMPHPDILREYKDLISDAPERILQMAEQEQQHRMAVERAMLEQNAKNIAEAAKANMRSQMFAFMLTLFLIVAGVTLTVLGFVAVGLTIFGTTIIGVVTVFITGKFAKQPNSENTRQKRGE